MRAAGLQTLFDDREAGTGEKLTDAELLGCPLRLVLGKRSLESGTVEAQARRGGEDLPGRAPRRGRRRRGRAVARSRHDVQEALRSGLDRSGGPPPETGPGAPLRPWTIPNAIGYVRAACLVAFVAVAMSSDDGTGALPFALFAIVAWGDYADGIAARVTGQYSRLGALMDPVIDRALVISGVVVTWRFELLPRWALAVLVAREALMLAAGPYVVRRVGELRITMLGRWAVWPTMAAIAFARGGVEDVAEPLLYVGPSLTMAATVQYARQLSTSA